MFGPPDVEKLRAAKDVKGLIKALGYKDWMVRSKAAKALGPLRDARATEPLIAALDDKLSRSDAIGSLGQIGDPRAVAPLVDIFLKDDSDAITVVWALSRLGAPAVDPLLAALKDEREKVRRRAAEARCETISVAQPMGSSIPRALSLKIYSPTWRSALALRS